MEAKDKRPRNHNPRASANPISVLFFWWTRKLLWRGRKGLSLDDMYETLPADRASLLADNLEREWQREVKNNKSPTLYKALRRTFLSSYILFGLILLIHCLVIRVAYPLCLGGLVSYFSSSTWAGIEDGVERKGAVPGVGPEGATKDAAIAFAGGLVLASTCNIFFYHHFNLGTQVLGMRVRVALTSLVYRKVLRLSQAAGSRVAAGQLINLLSNDVARFDQLFMYLHYMWVMPVQVIVITYFIWHAVGMAAFIGVCSLLVQTVPVQSYLSKVTSVLRLRIAQRTDDRVRLMAEIVSGIHVIKMYAWEKPFQALMESARKREVQVLLKASYLRGVYLAFMVFSERSSLFFTLLAYVLLGNELSADRVFMLAQFFNVLQLSAAIFYPNAVQMVAEASVSVERLKSFLLLEEQQGALPGGNSAEVVKESGLVEVTSVSARWLPGSITPTLSDVNVRVAPGKLCAVIGPVGAGKTSLLLTLLRELPVTQGECFVRGRLAYAAQEPWLFSSTLKNNIVFGRSFDSRRYRDVLRSCALTRDLQLLPRADDTPVGDRGAALSGGQRARVSLARAVYLDADVYLLDDPLSAVDAHVGKHLFDECICGLLADKTRILVTHQLQYLKDADHIVILNNGRIEMQGSYKELSASRVDFASLLARRDSGAGDIVKKPRKRRQSSTASEGGDKGTTAEVEEEEYEPENEPNEESEMLAQGPLQSYLYRVYATVGNSMCSLLFVLLLLLLGQLAASGCDFWVTYWTNTEDTWRAAQATAVKEAMSAAAMEATGVTSAWTNDSAAIVDDAINSTTLQPPLEPTLIPPTEEEEMKDMMQRNNGSGEDVMRAEIPWLPPGALVPSSTERWDTQVALLVYAGLVAACVILTTLRAIAFFAAAMRSARALHDSAFAAVLRAPMRFFDTNPSGRILNRFSKDMGSIDEMLPKYLLEAVQVFLVMSSILVMVAIVNPWFLLVVVFLGGAFLYLRNIYLGCAQDIKRLEGVTKSPVFSHLSASLSGLTTIRSTRSQDRLQVQFDELQDENTACWYLSLASSCAFGFCLDVFSLLFVSAVTFSFLIIDDGTQGGWVGLAISQALILTGMVQHGIRLSADASAQMTAVERVTQYSLIKPEPPLDTEPAHAPVKGWPRRGEISFDHVFLRYAEGEDPVLRDLTFIIEAGHKVGVVGRSGAGKSSLLAALFRLAPLEGSVRVDAAHTLRLGLHDLRRALAVIPQEPVLFSNTLRFNLSPFDGVTDAQLWEALDEVELKDAVEGLNAPVAEGGANFSVGQRQLVCLARAILRNNRILVLDEATANIDPQTDAFIQATIRRKFVDRTVLTIAHRLNTIMDSDKVLVMDAGQAVEYDHPHLLLQNKNGHFYALVHETGPSTANELTMIAQESYLRKQETTSNLDEFTKKTE